MNQQTSKAEPAKRGPKIKGASPRKKYLLNFDDDTNELLLEVGKGNKSEGLHLLAAFYREHAKQGQA